MTTSSHLSMKGVNFTAATIFVAVSSYFIYWGLGYTQYNHSVLFIISAVMGIFMAFNIGGNDVANSFGTSVGAGTLTIPQALAIAAVFEVSGAVLAGGEVTTTIRSGIVDLDSLNIQPLQFVYIMMAALTAAAFWLLFATRKGWPVSTTHAIIGGIVGWLASIIMKRDGQQGILLNIIVGIVGALIAGFLFGGGINEAITVRTFIFSLIGAVILLAIVNLFTRKSIR